MTREQRNVLADLIVAALHDESTDAALRALARVAEGPATIAAAAAARLVSVGLVAGEAPPAGTMPMVPVVLAPAFASVRLEVIERVRRALVASDAYWASRRGAPMPLTTPGRAPDILGGLRRSAALFDACLYFEVHEELEALWRRVRGETRIVVQGLLQIAVALHHAERGNLAGARRLLAAGRAKVAPHAPSWNGVAIGALLEDLESFEATRLDAGDPAPAPRLIVAP